MDKQAGEILVKYAAEIAKRCYPFKAGSQEPTPAQERARNDAWCLMSHLPAVIEQIKESDIFWMRGDMYEADGNEKEAQRCFALAHQADRAFVRPFSALERLLKEIEALEKKDPEAKKFAAEIAKATKARADMREQERLEKNAKARARNAAKKADIAAVKEAMTASLKKKLAAKKNPAKKSK